MRVAYFDCFCGAGGDMIVASLIGAGADATTLRRELESLDVRGYSLSVDAVTKQGFAATRFRVELEETTPQPHRNLGDITRILGGSTLPEPVRDMAIRIFERLAGAEAAVHGTTVDKVHFHEVGAVDAIVDVTAAVLALQQLGVERVICSPIPTGSGTVTCQHGVLPVPAPATAALLEGVPIAACDEPGELTTPTGAAILTTLATGYGPLPAMTVRSIGYGAGSRDGARRPNILRVMVGESATGDMTGEGGTDRITVLETNLDDASPEVVAFCMERLLAEGALDVYTVPIQMKKSRSGVVLTVLCDSAKAAAMERIVFAQTTTFGIRRRDMARVKLLRRIETVATPFGKIRVKVGERDGIVTASPEYEDCRAAAQTYDVALREVIAAANATWKHAANR